MPDVPISGVPPIPPLSTISDDKLDVKRVLKPLVDGWETRNGTTGDPDQAFVRVIDLREGRLLATEGATMVAAGKPRYKTVKIDGKDVRVLADSSGQAKPIAPAASAVADLIKGGTAEGLSDRVTTLESAEWFRQQLAKHGPAESAGASPAANNSSGGSGSSVKGYSDTPGQTDTVPTGVITSLDVDLTTGNTVLLMGECGYRRTRALDDPGGMFEAIEVVTHVDLVEMTVAKSFVRVLREDVTGGGTCDLALYVGAPSASPALLRFRSIVAGHAMVVANSTMTLYTATKTGTHTFELRAGERSGGYYAVGVGWPPSLVAVVM